MTGLCRAVDFGDGTVIDPQLVPMEQAEEWAHRLNNLYPWLDHMGLDNWQLAISLRICGVDSIEAHEIANDVFSGKIAGRFVVFYGSGRIVDWAES